MNLPDINNLIYQIDNLLKGFDPTTFMYLDNRCQWLEKPLSIRDRISNELWYSIWKSRQNEDFNKEFKNKIFPFIKNENSWDVASSIFKGMFDNESKGINSLLVIFEILYKLIEYDVHKRNSTVYVADWDFKGKIKRAQYLKNCETLWNSMTQLPDENIETIILTAMIEMLKEEKDGIFNKVSLIIAMEERIRSILNDLLTDIKVSGREDEIYDLINEQLYQSLGMTTIAMRQALLRPCAELLTNQNIHVSSGIHYVSSIILGILKDLRCTDSLLEVLRLYDSKYINLRSSAIFALGNLKCEKLTEHLITSLIGPDSIEISPGNGSTKYTQSLCPEKRESVWALGKLGINALSAIPILKKYSNDPDKELRTLLAWTMGKIGREQKSKSNGLDVDIVISLLNLLTSGDRNIFEEAAFALRNLGLPDFLHSLYLHNIETIPILSLKPSSIGLYELSETLLYFASIKKPVVMAVNGDSGTGKTYFCETIVKGFGEIQANEIFYLQRDNPAQMKILNRILGIKWLKEHVDPQYYDDYPLKESEDDPDEFFDELIKKYSRKKLIILDGWRDNEYFHQVVKNFYEKGYLDIIVNFRTTYATKRLNLEEREGSFENVKLCLSNIEKTLIEETRFYMEGKVLIYNLDNSIPSRLNREEISEVFQKKKIDSWSNYIRIGEFANNRPLKVNEKSLQSLWEDASFEIEKISPEEISHFTPNETKFSRRLNDNIVKEPNLLQEIKTRDFNVNRIAFYMPGQIAFGGYEGDVGILSGFNDRIFSFKTHDKEVVGLSVIKKDICSIDTDGKLRITSFHKNSIIDIGKNESPACSIISYLGSKIVTGHLDGTIKLWDIESKQVQIIKKHNNPVLALGIDYKGRLISGGKDKKLCIWDFVNNKVKIIYGHEAPITVLGLYPDGRIVTGTCLEGNFIKGKKSSDAECGIIDIETDTCKIFSISEAGIIKALNVYFDGRIIAGIKAPNNQHHRNNLIIIDPRQHFLNYKIIKSHKHETIDCITTGPRIITCGSENESKNTIRIWGTKDYVKMDIEKLKLTEDTMEKPPYYRSLF